VPSSWQAQYRAAQAVVAFGTAPEHFGRRMVQHAAEGITAPLLVGPGVQDERMPGGIDHRGRQADERPLAAQVRHEELPQAAHDQFGVARLELRINVAQLVDRKGRQARLADERPAGAPAAAP
jgi:hypothetical protein